MFWGNLVSIAVILIEAEMAWPIEFIFLALVGADLQRIPLHLGKNCIQVDGKGDKWKIIDAVNLAIYLKF